MLYTLVGLLISLLTTQTPTVSSGTTASEFGVQISTSVAGRVMALRFYREVGDPGPHTGHLWSGTGQLLATVLFTNETASGWQQQSIDPIAFPVGSIIVASVNSINGSHYAIRSKGFSSPIINSPLSATTGLIGNPGSFPTNKSLNNYFRDIVFDTSVSPETVSTGLTTGTAANGRLGIPGVITGLLNGNYSITLSLTDASGRLSSNTTNIQVQPFPFVNGDGTRSWAYTNVSATGESAASDILTIPGPLTGGPYFARVGAISVGPTGTIARNLYRTVAGGTQLKLVTRINDNVTTNYDDHVADTDLGVVAGFR